MPAITNKERLDRIDDRLAQIENWMGLKPPPSKRFITRKIEWIIANKVRAFVWTLVWSVLLSLVGVYGKYYLDHRNDAFNSAVDARISAELTKQGGVSEKLSNLQVTVNSVDTTLKTLVPFLQEVIKHQFESAAKLSPSGLQERLPAFQHLVVAAKDQGVKTEPDLLRTLAGKLNKADTNAAGFWPTAATFVSYHSAVMSPPVDVVLPECTDQEPAPSRIVEKPTTKNGTTEFKFSIREYSNCRVTLDSPSDNAKINYLIRTSAPYLTFSKCLVVYRGGPIDLILELKNEKYMFQTRNTSMLANFSGPTLTFKDCVFDFVVLTPPPPVGQQITKLFLSQPPDNVKIPVAKSS